MFSSDAPGQQFPTTGNNANTLAVQADGNIVASCGVGCNTWHTNLGCCCSSPPVQCSSGSVSTNTLVMQSNGNLEQWVDGSLYWQSNTAGTACDCAFQDSILYIRPVFPFFCLKTNKSWWDKIFLAGCYGITVANGNVAYSQPYPKNGISVYQINCQATVTCSSGYYLSSLSNSEVLTCNTWSWSPSSPTCICKTLFLPKRLPYHFLCSTIDRAGLAVTLSTVA